jgi:predicted nucleic acid-binding protein
MKVVLDSNVLVAVFVTEGAFASLLRRARQKEFLVIAFPFRLEKMEQGAALCGGLRSSF